MTGRGGRAPTPASPRQRGEGRGAGDAGAFPPRRRRRGGWRLAGFAAALALLAAPAAAQCRLALALALDVSSSVDRQEYRQQSEGLARALEDPEVRAAILTPETPVALAVYEWSGGPSSVLDWTLLTGPGALDAVIARIRATPRSRDDLPTALGRALGHGARLLARAPPCLRRTLDVSGDGENNHEFPPEAAFRHFDFAGITVNGLAIGGRNRPDLVEYYRLNVLHGPGAFLEVAANYRDFARAMRRKLLREVSGEIVMGARP